MSKLSFLKVKRKTSIENRYSRKMGRLVTTVTRIKLHFLGFPVKTLHEYRETYYGEIKELKNCDLSK